MCMFRSEKRAPRSSNYTLSDLVPQDFVRIEIDNHVWNRILFCPNPTPSPHRLHLCFFSGAFWVEGPHESLVAMLGVEAELPCFLLPAQSVKNMQISWSWSLPSELVHQYKDGRDQPEEAMEYFGRTELVRNVMYNGLAALKILNVRPSDNEQYCVGSNKAPCTMIVQLSWKW